jgi:hypothetical protein
MSNGLRDLWSRVEIREWYIEYNTNNFNYYNVLH